MKRAVVSVGTGRYKDGLLRLRAEVLKFGNCEMVDWEHNLPVGSPYQSVKPYAFKSYALIRAESIGHYDLMLWCDAAVVPTRDMEPLWRKIEEDGYWIPLNGWTNYEWTANSAYPDLFPERSIEEAREVNKAIPHCCATAFGMNLRHPLGAAILNEYYRLAQTNAFCGPWSNLRNPKHWNYCPEMMGDCGPEDVLGHRHDQTALSVIAWRIGVKLTPCPEFFAYPPGADNTILLAVGA